MAGYTAFDPTASTGGGAVSSVNSKTGAVTLNQDDVASGTTAKQYTATEQTKLAAISGTNSGDQTITLTGDVTGSGTGSFATAIGAGVVVNADVNASAAIGLSKLAATTVSRALVSDASGFVSPATTTATEIGYMNGVTSAIQTQLNAKAPINSPAFTGTPTGITATHIGLGNVDNTSDATKNTASVTLTNKTIDAASNTITNVSNLSVKRQNNTTDSSVSGARIETGWGVFAQGASSNKSEAVTFNTAFTTAPIITISYNGDQTGGTIAYGNGGNTEKGPVAIKSYGATTTGFTAHAHTSDGTIWSATANIYYTWIAIGS